ncbi:MAG: LVIVD repeat-containing protein [Bacteroidia bacterium]
MKYLYSLIIISVLALYNNANAQVYDFQNITLKSNWFDPAVVPEPFYGIKYNGMWAWHDGNGNEYAIIGSTAGFYFVDVTDPFNPVMRDFVAGKKDSAIWREVKTYNNYAYLVSDASPPNSFQIVDLSYLPDSVHVVHDNNTIFERAHALWVDNDKLYVAIPKGGLFTQASMAVFSLANPEAPVLLRKLNDDFPSINSVHDMYVRNDTVFASAEFSGLYIFTFTGNTFQIKGSVTTYPQQGYNHSSALSEDGNTLIFMDEVPEGLAVKVLDVSDINNPSIITIFESNPGATPHNPFILGDQVFIAYYQDGLQVFDISDPAMPVRTGYFDTYWQNPAGVYTQPPYAGAWGAYP